MLQEVYDLLQDILGDPLLADLPEVCVGRLF